jgi:Holliday junction resolvase RusA-like endonuclease
MKKLVISSEGGFHQSYQSRLTKYRIKQEFITAFEITCLGIVITLCFIMFLIFVNKSSTQGYFLRQANTAFDNTNFTFNMVKTDILNLQKNNRDKLNNSDLYGPSINLLDANIESIIVK